MENVRFEVVPRPDRGPSTAGFTVRGPQPGTRASLTPNMHTVRMDRTVRARVRC